MTIQNREGRFTATYRKPGYKSISDTFGTRREAESWLATMKARHAMKRDAIEDAKELRATTVAKLLENFRDEVCPERKGCRWEQNRIKHFLQTPWAAMTLDMDIARSLREWRDWRLTKPNPKGVIATPQTVKRDFNLISSIFTFAIKEWGYAMANPAKAVLRPEGADAERETIWEPEHIELFLAHFEFDENKAPERKTDYIPWFIIIANATGLRRRSLVQTQLAWIDLKTRGITYKSELMKNGLPYRCPLSQEAVRWIAKLVEHQRAKGSDRLFDIHEESLTTLYGQERAVLAEKHPEVAGLRLHDLRHTYSTWLVGTKKIALADFMKITGRRSMKEALRYYNPKVQDLAAMLD
jgi:integrase